MTSQQPPAVVVGLNSITGLQSARILARRGVPVFGVTGSLSHYTSRTNVCERIVETDLNDEAALAETLVALAETLGQKAVLVPCSDPTVLAIARHRARLEPLYHISLPELRTLELLMDKVRFYAYAQDCGLPVPRMFLLSSREDAERTADELAFPVILKPPFKTPRWEANTKIKAYKVPSREAFLELYDRCSAWADELMVQEYVEGPDANLYSCNGYFNGTGEPLVTFVARKLRQWPPETGTSCLGEEVRNDEVLEETVKLFRALNYRGLGYVEMKRDKRTGKHYLIEPNAGRPTGRSAIAEAGGVELLYTMYCDAAGLPLPENRQQQYRGVKWIYLRWDFQSALHYWRRGELSLREWWRSVRGPKGYAVFSLSDPAPFLTDIVRSVRTALLGARDPGAQPRRSDVKVNL